MKRKNHGVRLTEEIDYRTASVDAEAGVIRGVRIIGPTSKNKRRYEESALRRAASLYEGQRVNANHSAPNQKERSVQDRIGKLTNVQHKDGGLVGDLHYFKTHPLAPLLAEAVSRPELQNTMGLSHNAEGRTRSENGTQVVEEITAVYSVDLVADPATTQSLFESTETMAMEDESAVPAAPQGDMTVEMFLAKAREIAEGDGDGAAKAKKISDLAKALFKIKDQLDAALAGDAAKPAAEEAATESAKAQAGKLQEQQAAQLDAYKRLAESRRFPRPEWVAAVAAVPAEARAALIETLPVQPLAEASRSASPTAALQESHHKPITSAAEFASAIRG